MSGRHFEPEVLALLEEIARSPEGSLIRIPRERLAYHGDPREMLTPHGSFLSRAERHLVTAYREEAAQVLLEACILQLSREAQIYSTLKADERELRTRARPLSGRLASERDLPKSLWFLGNGDHVSYTDLATASVRLVPTDLGFSALANCYQKERLFRSSLRVLARFHDAGVSNFRRAQGFANMAKAYSLQGNYMRAFELGLQALRLDEGHSRFAIWCMTDALQAGNEGALLESAKLLDNAPDLHDYSESLTLLRKDRDRSAWTPTLASRKLSARLRSTLSPRTGAICELFS